MSKQNYAIIVAGGSGSRMGTAVPKQFIPLAGLPVLMHTLKQFVVFDAHIKLIVALPESQHAYWEDLKNAYEFTIPHQTVTGGKERFFSVKNALALVDGPGLVAVHDGVRPLVSLGTIQRTFEKAAGSGAAIPVVPVNESLREVHAATQANKAVNRAAYKLVQTPQVFHTQLLLEAYGQDYQSFYTDDASVVESLGHAIHLVEGNEENIKITRPMDLHVATFLLQKE